MSLQFLVKLTLLSVKLCKGIATLTELSYEDLHLQHPAKPMHCTAKTKNGGRLTYIAAIETTVAIAQKTIHGVRMPSLTSGSAFRTSTKRTQESCHICTPFLPNSHTIPSHDYHSYTTPTPLVHHSYSILFHEEDPQIQTHNISKLCTSLRRLANQW